MSQYSQQELSNENRQQLLLSAIAKRSKLEIAYTKANGELSRRIIIPLKIKEDKLLAFCTQRQEQRTFVLERILKAHIHNDN